MSDFEVVVVGGGPAGAAAAIGLAQAGRRVAVIERDAVAREKVCGEFLGPGATDLLSGLGLAPWTLGAVRLRRARLAHRRRTVEIPLPFSGWGLRREVLDAALLAAADAAGVAVVRGRGVVSAGLEQGVWRARLAGGETVAAPAMVLATGKHELRGHGRGVRRGAVGQKLHVRLADALEGTVLLPAAGDYAGLQPSGGGLANLCMALHGEPARDSWELIERVAGASGLGARLLGGAVPLWDRPLAVAGVPYGFLFSGKSEPGLYRVGDQFAVVPSFCGEGMGMALSGGFKVAAAIASGTGSAAFHQQWRRDLAVPMRWAGVAGWMLGAAPGLLTLAAGWPGAGRLVAARTRVM